MEDDDIVVGGEHEGQWQGRRGSGGLAIAIRCHVHWIWQSSLSSSSFSIFLHCFSLSLSLFSFGSAFGIGRRNGCFERGREEVGRDVEMVGVMEFRSLLVSDGIRLGRDGFGFVLGS